MTDTEPFQTTWPTYAGPIKTLQGLGMIPEGTQRLPWTVTTSVQIYEGKTVYKATSRYLTKQALRALAALTLEDWNVRVSPTGDELKITISEATN